MTAGGSTYMPLRVNMAGVIPIIFAAAIMAFPPTVAQFFPQTQNFINENFSPTALPYLLLQGFMIVIFTYFYTAVSSTQSTRPTTCASTAATSWHPAWAAHGAVPGPGAHPPHASGRALPGARGDAADPLHPLRRLLPGDLGRARAGPRSSSWWASHSTPCARWSRR